MYHSPKIVTREMSVVKTLSVCNQHTQPQPQARIGNTVREERASRNHILLWSYYTCDDAMDNFRPLSVMHPSLSLKCWVDNIHLLTIDHCVPFHCTTFINQTRHLHFITQPTVSFFFVVVWVPPEPEVIDL